MPEPWPLGPPAVARTTCDGGPCLAVHVPTASAPPWSVARGQLPAPACTWGAARGQQRQVRQKWCEASKLKPQKFRKMIIFKTYYL